MESSATVVPVSTTPESQETRDGDFVSALEAAKLQALYNFVYGLSHEINNPLANIATRAQTLLVDEKNPERRRKLATIVQQAFRAHEMIADLMLFARPPAIRPESADLAALADTVVAEMQDQARDQATKLTRTGASSPLLAHLDRTQIAVALKAIIQNSLEAVREGGSVDVTVSVESPQDVLSTKYSVLSTRESADHVGSTTHHLDTPSSPTPHFPLSPPLLLPHSPPLAPGHPLRGSTPHFLLTITDTGPGIPPHIRPHIFDPFFSGREAGRGLGLGLSKAWRIVDLHGGRIEVESTQGQGATFAIALPT